MLRNTVAGALGGAGQPAARRPGARRPVLTSGVPAGRHRTGAVRPARRPGGAPLVVGRTRAGASQPASAARLAATRAHGPADDRCARGRPGGARAERVSDLGRQGDPAWAIKVMVLGADSPGAVDDGRRAGPRAPAWKPNPALAAVGARRRRAVLARRPDRARREGHRRPRQPPAGPARRRRDAARRRRDRRDRGVRDRDRGLLLVRRPLVSARSGARRSARPQTPAPAPPCCSSCAWRRWRSGSAIRLPRRCWFRPFTCGCGCSTRTTGIPRPVVALFVLVGLAPPVIVILYYSQSLGLSPLQTVWNGVLLIAGGYIGLLAAVQWSVVLGCLVSVISIAARRPRLHRSRPEQTPVTVRGPASYAGPGSLGGTESALRR